MRSIRLVALVALFAAGARAQEAPTLDSVFERLSSVSTLRGEFEQTRKIAVLSQPLQSRGRFIVSELGLYWEQTAPFPTLLIASGESLIQRVASQPAVTVSSAEQPMAVSIARVFLSIFKGNRGNLDEHFTVDFEPTDEGWTIDLVPKTFPLTEAVQRIVIDGDEYFERLRVVGVADDELIVEFHDQTSEPPSLTSEERELYSP